MDVTDATGTGHLQKGHGVAFADLDGDGNEEVVLNVGGAVQGDRYEDALFQNPGAATGTTGSRSASRGVKTNRAAIGARITLTLEGARHALPHPHREVTSGGSFGASPLHAAHRPRASERQSKTLEVYWPVSRTTQVFHDVPADSHIDLTELATRYDVVPQRVVVLGGGTR